MHCRSTQRKTSTKREWAQLDHAIIAADNKSVVSTYLGGTLQCDTQLWNHDIEFARWQHLQCGRWLWDNMPLNSPKRPPYWNSTSGFDFDHITAVDRLFCTSVRNFIQIGPPSTEKNDVMSIFKMADLSHLGFQGSRKAHVRLPIGRQQRPQL